MEVILLLSHVFIGAVSLAALFSFYKLMEWLVRANIALRNV